MINVLVIVMEAITMWLCLHIAFGEKIKRTKGEALFFVVYIPVFIFCSFGVFIEVLYFLLWVFIAVWCKILFARKLLGTIFRTVVGIVTVGVVEVVVVFLYTIVTVGLELPVEIDCVVASVCMIIVVAVIYLYLCDNKQYKFKNLFDNSILLIIFFMAIFLFYVKLEFEVKRTVPFTYIFFFTVLAIIFIFLCKKQKSIYELEKKNINYELHNMYGSAYEELLKEVRRKQHDYKNQLIAIQSVLENVEFSDKLKHIQEEYLGIIEGENEINSILSKCYNPIIAGYLYNMYVKCRDKNIKLLIDVHIVEDEVDIKTKDIIELLGVFLVNAIEHIELHVESDKIIQSTLHQNDEKILIEVRNVADYISYEKITQMFEEGHSTKGKNRGLGLYLAKNIAEKYSSYVCIENVLVNDKNWVSFSSVI